MFSENAYQLVMDGLQITKHPAERVYAKFDITLYVSQNSDGVELSWVYNRDLFDETRITHLGAQYIDLLNQVIASSEEQVANLTLVTPAARGFLPDPTLPFAAPNYPLVTQSIAEWAARTPNGLALKDDQAAWSYRELDTHVQQIAQNLISQGVQPGDVVAITGPASNQLAATLIGTWLAGGVILTINPDFSAAHKQQILKRAGAKYLVIADPPETKPDWASDVQLIQPSDSPVPSAPYPALAPEDPAYVFFTSGTTGEPKGILGNHKGLSHFLAWQRQTFEIEPTYRFAQTTKLSFDVLLRDMFLPLTSGSSLTISNSKTYQFDFLNWLRQENITHLHQVPSVLTFWLKESDSFSQGFPDLQTIFLAGEPLQANLVTEVRKRLGNALELVNLYGPTETTLAKSFYRIPNPHLPGIQPIGTPLPETQLLVLNPADQLCGIFEPGEIVIRTPFKTLGYLSDEAFERNPFTKTEGDLIYRSGDLGWYLPDGQIAIGGRRDEQIKIRGVRVEPAAIKSLLDQHPAVKNSAVIARRAPNGELYLSAYIVPTEAALNNQPILDYLQDHLPPACLPATLTTLEKIPLTANGKLDRAALPQPISTTATDIDNPQSELEHKLVGIMKEVLQADHIKMTSTFFELGGHSLLAIQILNRIRDEFSVELPLPALFENPTMRAIATLIANFVQPSQSGDV